MNAALKVPRLEKFLVDRVAYSEHAPPAKRSSMKISYESGYRVFHEWLHIGAGGFLGATAANWWMRRSPQSAPLTVEDALARTAERAGDEEGCEAGHYKPGTLHLNISIRDNSCIACGR